MSERILLLDDEHGITQALSRLLRVGLADLMGPQDGGLQVEAYNDPQAALQRASNTAFALAVSDYRMPQMNGVEFLTALRQLQPDCVRVILSGYTDLNGLMAAINQAGIARFVPKPWQDHELLCALRDLLHIRRLDLENRQLADLARVQSGQLSPQELERRRLEALEPGITHVEWTADGAIVLDGVELPEAWSSIAPPLTPPDKEPR